MNGVAMTRHGLILSEDGATSLRKVFKYLPGLREAILNLKMTAQIRESKHHTCYRVFILLHDEGGLH